MHETVTVPLVQCPGAGVHVEHVQSGLPPAVLRRQCGHLLREGLPTSSPRASVDTAMPSGISRPGRRAREQAQQGQSPGAGDRSVGAQDVAGRAAGQRPARVAVADWVSERISCPGRGRTVAILRAWPSSAGVGEVNPVGLAQMPGRRPGRYHRGDGGTAPYPDLRVLPVASRGPLADGDGPACLSAVRALLHELGVCLSLTRRPGAVEVLPGSPGS